MPGNYAWQKARYPLIIYVDDDIRCGNDLIREHVAAYRDADIGAVAGGIDERRTGRTAAQKRLPTILGRQRPRGATTRTGCLKLITFRAVIFPRR